MYRVPTLRVITDQGIHVNQSRTIRQLEHSLASHNASGSSRTEAGAVPPLWLVRAVPPAPVGFDAAGFDRAVRRDHTERRGPVVTELVAARTHRTTPSHAPPRAPGRALLRRPDALLRHLHPLDAFEAEQELNTIRRGVGGGLLKHGAEGLLDVLTELHALDRQVREVDLDALIRSKH
jgi:hypothetical protein